LKSREEKDATDVARKDVLQTRGGVCARALTFAFVSQRKLQVSITV
jgi:hypothetical protein